MESLTKDKECINQIDRCNEIVKQYDQSILTRTVAFANLMSKTHNQIRPININHLILRYQS